jgi:hypothetical protein
LGAALHGRCTCGPGGFIVARMKGGARSRLANVAVAEAPDGAKAPLGFVAATRLIMRTHGSPRQGGDSCAVFGVCAKEAVKSAKKEVRGRRVAKSAKVGGLEICKFLGFRSKAAKSAKKNGCGGRERRAGSRQRKRFRIADFGLGKKRGGECGRMGECGEASRRIAGERI